MVSNNTLADDKDVGIPESSFDEIIQKYISYAPLIIISIIVALATGYIFSRYTPVIFSSSTTLLVREPDNKNASTDLLDQLLGNSRVNLDNEIEVLKSTPLALRVVERLDLNIHYRITGKIRKTESTALQVPFKLLFTSIEDSSKPITFGIHINDHNNYTINYLEKNSKVKAGDTLRLKGFSIVITPNFSRQVEAKSDFSILWNPFKTEAALIAGSLKVTKIEKMSTILKLTITGLNKELNEAILSGLISDYKQMNLENKNEIATNTIRFIDERLNIVTKELSGVEENLKQYKTANKIVNPESQSSAFITGSADLHKEFSTVSVKLQVLTMVQNYLSSKSNSNKLVPSNLGIEDPVLLELVQTYNTLQLKKDASLKSGIPPLSPLIENFNNQLNLTKTSILENLKNIKQALTANLSNVTSEISNLNKHINLLPENEQRIKEISRQTGIKESLYLYLLQKREENAITTAGNISNYYMVEPPVSGIESPKKMRILMISGLLGLLIPLSFIYIKGLLNSKILHRSEVNKLGLPIVGEIGSMHRGDHPILTSGSRSVISEQFRIIRTNIQYLSKGKENLTILFTSTISGEGKSFSSTNIALIFSFSGKKTALMEFDLRKPKAFTQLKLNPEPDQKGITDFLIGKAEAHELPIAHPDYPNLTVFKAGIVPPNPSELLLTDRLKTLMDYVKSNYDIIIIDSAPVGLVSDTFTLAPYSDVTLYLIRQGFSYKKQLLFIDELYREQRLLNMGIVINDVKYGSSYGYRYSYYGNSYGYFDATPVNFWSKIKNLFNPG